MYWHRFGKPDKRRPVLVLTRTSSLGRLSTATVAAISTTRRGAPSEVPLEADEGLPRACAVNLHQVFTLQQADLGPYLATLAPSRMRQVDAALQFALGVGEHGHDA